jgi:ABC-type dipeptide/oligopeptide/nickel transport system ATPase component
MKEGRIVEQGTFAQLYRKPSHPYTRSLVRASRTVDLDGTFDWQEPVHVMEEFVR